MNRLCRVPVVPLWFVLSLASPAADASLGSTPSKFDSANARHAQVLAAATSTAGYSVNLTTLPSGTIVREYVGTNGLVFAVSWTGPFLPDLKSLLGQHFGTLTDESARRPKAGHSQLRIKRPDVTIESTGHMRAYAGRAWIQSMLPNGFKTGDIE